MKNVLYAKDFIKDSQKFKTDDLYMKVLLPKNMDNQK